MSTSTSGGAAMVRYSCDFEGCGKSFQRKEHLARHEKSHNPETLFACTMCDKKFSRSDSLQRHLSRRHTLAFKPPSSKRSKKACLICHAGKIKCDGDQPCATCLKKGLECLYRQEATRELSEQSSDHPGDLGPSDNILEPTPIDQDPVISAPDDANSRDPEHLSDGAMEITPLPIEQSIPFSISLAPPSVLQAHSIINWLSVKVTKDPEIPKDSEFPSEEPEEAEQYSKCYFERFHDRWPIIHRPSYRGHQNIAVINSSVLMIGAWLEGSEASKQYAVKMHSNFVDLLLSRLSKVTFRDTFQGSFQPEIFQTALINIIFVLYCGDISLLSKVLLLRTALVSALRQMNFFNAETAWADEKPGYFIAARMHRLGQRQRLASYLFRADTYLNLLQGQPPLITLEELHFSLPCSFALWNAYGLDIWEERYAIESPSRMEKSLYAMIKEGTSESTLMTEFPMLIEDLQLCMCSLQGSIWKISLSDLSESCQIDLVLQKDTLRRQLLIVKEKLDRIANQNIDSAAFGDENYMPLKQYFGFEYNIQPDWQEIVKSRVKSIIFDASMLYNLLALHLHADIQTLTCLARYQNLTPIQETSERHRQIREKREESTRNWVGTPTARQALCLAVDILHGHQILQSNGESTIPQNKAPDPVAYLALSTAILVVWSYCHFNKPKCDHCVGKLLSDILAGDAGPLVELTSFTTSVPEQEQWRKSFIEMGENCRMQIQGVLLCGCNTRFLVPMFRAWLPDEWKLANVVAPGIIFQESS